MFLIAAFSFAAPSAAAEHGVGAYNIKITSDYVKAAGVCSCSLCSDRYHHTVVFKNYCPNCHLKGTLTFEQGSASWTSPEGLWYCTRCDMDYCLVHGKSHDSRGEYLTHTTEPVTQPVTQNVTPDTPKVQAQTIDEGYVELIVSNQKYKFKKSELNKFKFENTSISEL
ncbi:MAG: hypothetical protein HZC47_03080 [Methanobacterium sp.]|uniref:hypothetical protein n=1 Tax=Methanobacterium sp. TaxID=2164 RepID=UPI003D65E2FA|nr:hypothetical protein [Methanobacterium sp.]